MSKVRTGGPRGHGSHDEADLPSAIRNLDPESGDPGYWERFRFRVMSRAAAELARRRRPHATVGGVLKDWAKAIVPIAAAAAVVALSFVWAERRADDTSLMGLEEALTVGLEGEVLPALLGGGDSDEAGAFIFALETF